MPLPRPRAAFALTGKNAPRIQTGEIFFRALSA